MAKRKSEPVYASRYRDIDRAIGIIEKRLGKRGADIAVAAIQNRPERVVKRGRSNVPTLRDVDAFIRAERRLESGRASTAGELAFDQFRGTRPYKFLQQIKGRVSARKRAELEAQGLNVPEFWTDSLKGEIILQSAGHHPGSLYDESNLPGHLKGEIGTDILDPEEQDAMDMYNKLRAVARYKNPRATEKEITKQVREDLRQNEADLVASAFAKLAKERAK